MQVALHLGAHCTDEDRLLRTLLQNVGELSVEGVSVPGPGRYRDLLKHEAAKLKGEKASEALQKEIKSKIIDHDSAKRVILSNENFICVPGRTFENGVLYDKSSFKTKWIRNLFPDDEVEFYLSIRNPATFLPAVFTHEAQKWRRFDKFMRGADILDIRWSDIVVTIQEFNPGCSVNVWCNEDTPLIWPEILRTICGNPDIDEFIGENSILESIMSPVGFERLNKYLETHPPKNEVQKRRILSAFLDKFVIADEVDEEIDLPGWTEELVEELTDLYEEDIEEIRNLPYVNFIEP